MRAGIMALLFYGGMGLLGIAAVYGYIVLTGDETGAKLQPFARKSGNTTTPGGNYTLPQISVPTSRNQPQQQEGGPSQSQLPPRWWFGTSANSSANAATYFYDSLAAQEEQYEPWASR